MSVPILLSRFGLSAVCLLVLGMPLAYAQTPSAQMPGVGPHPNLNEPQRLKGTLTLRRMDIVGWPDGVTPTAPEDFTVTKFADNLKNPRWLYILPNNDVLVSEASTDEDESANRITILRDKNNDGVADTRGVFLKNLNQPFGMLMHGDHFYVANTDGVWRYPYHRGQWRITGKGKQIISLPAGGYNNHWTRNIALSKDQKKLLVTVGSGSNVGEHGMEHEERRAAILEYNLDGTGETVFASGLRNPNALAFEPTTGALWTAVNERDQLGDDLVPDYITHVQRGGFYGWPYSYFGQVEDPRRAGERPDLVAKAITPDYGIGSHTASLGMAFYTNSTFPARYHGGAFIAQHGSWNRSDYSGYRVIYVPFKNGMPDGMPEDFLNGFVKSIDDDEAHGRPVGLAVRSNGALLVSDDSGNAIWQVTAKPTR